MADRFQEGVSGFDRLLAGGFLLMPTDGKLYERYGVNGHRQSDTLGPGSLHLSPCSLPRSAGS